MHNIASSSIIGAKTVNEDSLRVSQSENATQICVADGHWGAQAAQEITGFWHKCNEFPADRKSAVASTRHIESQLDTMFGQANMNAEIDLTPEAAFVAAELRNNKLTFVSYGDCRLVVIRGSQIIARNTLRATWLGAFSHRGLRKREAVQTALEWNQVNLTTGDTVLIYTDGIDECVYETPTISDQFFIEACEHDTPQTIHDVIMSEVQLYGAEDNATLVVIRV